MRIVVTGALGDLGSVVTRLLRGHRFDVVPTDLEAGTVDGVAVRPADLADPEPWPGLVDGAGAVVHCAAEPHGGARPADVMLETNVGGTARLCEASIRAGVEKFVFASTIQVVVSEGVADDAGSRVPYLPMDGDCPVNPANPYAFSKAAAEAVVRSLLEPAGISCQCLRFPWLVEPRDDGPWGRTLPPFDVRERRVVADQGFSCLSFEDAARLILACLTAPLPGFRTYLPAVSAVPAEDVARYVTKYFPDVPLTTPAEEMSGLIDLSRIRRDTGWEPRDIPPPRVHARPGGWLRRLLRRFR